ncbi:MAG TPA: hypothetical protein VJP87_02035 [Candidatus Acidoferrales bacterium]|nr:hypothetical protein [Candidatus Acidoferrales bacterium]
MNAKTMQEPEVVDIKWKARDSFSNERQEASLKARVGSEESRQFELRCHAENAGHLAVASSAVSVRISQRIRKGTEEEFWESLLVQCKVQDDGSLLVEVLAFHPDWDEPLRIAAFRSDPTGANDAGLRVDLERKSL